MNEPSTLQLTFFTAPECSLCASAWFVVNKVAQTAGVEVERVDITAPENASWLARYREHIPVLHLNGEEIFRHRVDEAALRRLLCKARRNA